MERPDLIRSWTVDIAGVFDPEYEWHEMAQVWATPGAGEEAVEQMLAAPVNEHKAASKPGLVILATDDHFVGTEAMARRVAERAGAKVAVLEGLGHWWMCQDPKRGARALEAFFASLG